MYKSIIMLLLLSCGGFERSNCYVHGAGCKDTVPLRSPVLSCSVTQSGNGATINCPDGSSAQILNGIDGYDGKDGQSCSVSQSDDGAIIECASNSVVIQHGVNGLDGADGTNGVDGINGNSCSVSQQLNGAIIICTDGSNAIIVDGQDGQDGEDGLDAPTSPYTFVDIIDPCGDQPGFDEILFVTAGGDYIAHYAHKRKQFLTILSPGSYRTTDGHNCHFSIDNNGVYHE